MKCAERSPECLEINKRGGRLVTVCTPYHKYLEPHFSYCLSQLVAESLKHNIFIDEVQTENTNVIGTRNAMVREYFHGDYLLFADADQVFPPTSLAKLIRWNQPIVGALIIQRVQPYMPCAAYGNPQDGYCKVFNWPENALIETDVVGMGLTLIKREVFEQIEDENPFDPIYVEEDKSLAAEDYSFCYRAQQAGFRILVDTSIPVGHIGRFTFYPEHFAKNHRMDVIKECSHRPYFDKAINPTVAVDVEPGRKS